MSKKQQVDYNVEYSPDVQRHYVNVLLSNPDAFARARGILKEEYFHSTVRAAVRYMLEYADTHHAMPSVEYIRAKSYVEVEKFSEPEVPQHQEWLLKEIEAFCRYKALENIIYDGPDFLARGEGGEIERRVKEAMTISLMSDLGTCHFEDPVGRQKRLADKSNVVSTGWSGLDRKLYGGFTRGSLNIFAGGSGSGKSLFLQNLALNWAFAGLNVVYVSLELSEELVCQRVDAMMTGRGTQDVFRHPEAVLKDFADRPDLTDRLYVKRLPEGGTTASDIRVLLKEYQIKKSIKPDAVIVDYLDLLYPISSRIDVGDHFVRDKFTSEELRGLAHEFNVLCVTASQLNRSSVSASEFDHSHIAGGISKINTADNVFAIHTSATLRDEGRYVLQLLKTRSAACVGAKVELAYDKLSMRITDAAVAAPQVAMPTTAASPPVAKTVVQRAAEKLRAKG